MNNNDMNIELLKALRGVWIIEIETLEKILLSCPKESVNMYCGKLEGLNQCLKDLISIIGE